MVVLGVGLFATITATQQNQDNRTRAASGVNNVTNSGFESGTTGWAMGNQNGGASTLTSTTANKVSGTTGGQVNVTTVTGTSWHVQLGHKTIPVTAGVSHTISFWAKTSVNAVVEIDLHQELAGGGAGPVYIVKTFNATPTWQQFSFTYTPTKTENLYLAVNIGKTVGTYWFDDFAIYSGSLTAPTATATTAPLPSAPTGLTATPGDAQITLNWNTMTDHWYYVYVRNVTKGETAFTKLQYPTTTATLIYKPTTNGETNEFKVSAINGSGGEGPLSAAVSAVSKVSIPPTATKAPTAVPPTATKAPTAVPPTATTAPTAIMTINKSSYTKGESITTYWSNIPNATAKDWIGLYTPTAASGSEIGWIYVNCTQTATVAVATGSCTFPIPDTAPAGSLELRLHPNEGNTVVAKSPLFNLVAPIATATLVPTATKTPTPTSVVPTATKTPTPTIAPTAIALTNTPAPTSTPVPGNTFVTVNLLLHGLGKGGDAVNAGGTGNMSPVRSQRIVTVDVYDVQNQLVGSKQGTVSFNATLGNFSGNVDLGSQFNTGIYTVKVKTDQYLRGLVSGIQTITKGQTANLASLTLVSGDVNNDNAINIVDYNLIVGCYSDLLPPISCNTLNEVRADLNDDGNVNQFDYNLFIRELTNLGGQ